MTDGYAASPEQSRMATDPVCGMYVDEGTHLTAVVRGRKYYFCAETCLETFTAPEKEMARLKRRTLFSLGIGTPLFVVGLGQGLGWWLAGLEEPVNLVFFVLATPVQFVAGYRFYRGFGDAIRNKSANMDVLIAIGTTAAWGYSAVVTFLPVFGVLLADKGTYYDTAAVIIGLILLGKYFEENAKGRAGDAVRKLMDLAPRTARVVRDGKEEEIPVELVPAISGSRGVCSRPSGRRDCGAHVLPLVRAARGIGRPRSRVLHRGLDYRMSLRPAH